MNSRSTAKAGFANPALQHLQLVAKHHQLDILAQIGGGAGDELEQAAQQQVRERLGACGSPAGSGSGDPSSIHAKASAGSLVSQRRRLTQLPDDMPLEGARRT